MSKKSKQPKYLESASFDTIRLADSKVDAIRAAKRKPKKLKIEPVIPTVVRCLKLGKSSRRIVSIVKEIHGHCISKDSILRFAKNWSGAISAH